MKKATILILIILASGLYLYNRLKTPNYIKINHAEAQRCFEDMQKNKGLICD